MKQTKKIIMSVLTLFASLSLTSCGTLFDKDNTPSPTPLKSFPAERQIKLVWQTHTGSGSGKEFLRLVPAVKNGLIFAAGSQQGRFQRLIKPPGNVSGVLESEV